MASVEAKDVKLYSTLAGIDNGYVVDVERDDVCINVGNYGNGLVLTDMVTITFHDAQGEENYLILTPETPVEIS